MRTRVAAVFLAVAASAMAFADPPTPQQLRGRQIYIRGESASGRELIAVTGKDEVRMPAGVLPCAGCHGYDGRGKPEGGVKPADISNDSLRRDSDGARTNGRKRPAYNDTSLTRAIAMGIDSGRNALDETMPRYRMSRDDMRDLVAYLDLLGDEKDPGLEDDAITIGVVVPDDAASARESLERLAAKANEDGIYGRKLRFRFAAKPSAFDAEPFLIIDTTPAGDATRVLAEQRRMPAILASTAASSEPGRYAFQLLGGTREAALTLLAHARTTAKGTGLLILHNQANAALAAEIAKSGGWDIRLQTGAWTPNVLDDRHAVLLLGDPGSVLDRIAARPDPPLVLLPAAVVQGSLPPTPPALDGRVLVAFPAIPTADAPRLVALASAAILLNALEALGRDVTREGFVDHLQTLHRFDSGWLPPVTWTPTQRTGTVGAYLMTTDRANGRLVGRPGWVEGER